MNTRSQRILWFAWGIALVLLLAASALLAPAEQANQSRTPLLDALRVRLERRSAKARVVREALTQAEDSHRLTFSLPGGYFEHDIRLEIHPGAPKTKILFTMDGSLPQEGTGEFYQHSIYLDSRHPGVTVVRAREVFEGGQLGPVASASYVMGVQARLPILSLIVDPADLADMETHELARGQAWEHPVHLTYLTPDRQAGFALGAGMRIRSEGLKAVPKKSFWLYFRQEYGQARLEYPLFPNEAVRSFKRLVLDAGGNPADKTLRWTLLENQISSELTQEAGGYAPQGQFVLLFLNGQPWGIYNLRERLDRFFLEDHLNIQDADLIETRQAQSGDLAHWEGLLDFVQNNSLADEQNFAFVQTQVDLQNFTDYVIIQMYTANDDWPQHYAVRARPRVPGGRWFWLSWDTTRGYGATGNPDFNAVEWATRSYPLSQHEGGRWLFSTLLLHSLLQNDNYRAAFVSRAADLLNTVLASESVIARVDRNAALLAEDIHYEENRWPSPLSLQGTQPAQGGFAPTRAIASDDNSVWQTNIHALRAWVRVRPDQMRRELMGKFGLTETVKLEFMPPSSGQGYVVVNGWPLRELPWGGIYFHSTEVHITAVPDAKRGYVFAGWEAPDLPPTPQITLRALAPSELSSPANFQPRFVQAPTNALRPNDAIFNEIWINDNSTHYPSLRGRAIEGDWFEMLVTRDKLDMRGWRITDNNTKTATDEGSLILPHTDAFAALPPGTVILVIATESESNALNFPQDDLDASDGQMILYAGNGTLDTQTDPGFGLGRSNDNLVLLAPGPTDSFADDAGIDFVAEGSTVTPLSFGILADGVVFDQPFRRLSANNGCIFTLNRARGRAPFDNDDGSDPLAGDNQPGSGGWIVDPGRAYSGDDVMPGAKNILSPGQLNPDQAFKLRLRNK